ncbi:type II secretion system F family protein [Lignipirellula cremea]|uniref:Bacterial type II secretion system protein F domain protein n=1 Tax=Lignipirellula cremea TaxID=2528010 RepID=A0A518E543_9BACT|nr:type II secretion system F family protein [Lignipirellula cremea]QDU99204.1 Bacterial type II secretion system protein F domain protein [Lignipirellula cremea]
MYVAVLTAGAFFSIFLLLFILGRLVFGIGRNDTEAAIGSKRPLVLGGITEAFAGVLPVTQSKRDSLQADLTRAGYHHRKALAEFLGMRNAAATGWVIFIAAAIVLTTQPGENFSTQFAIFGAVVLLIIFTLPKLTLSALATGRCSRIEYALPDALDMINMMVTGGLPLRRAVERVSAELKTTHPDLACELAIVDHQTEAGSLQQALREFAKRIDAPDVIALASMVQHADRLGGNVAGALRDFSDGVRRTRRQRAEERGNKASVKILFPIVLCLTPPIYVLLLGPGILEMRNFFVKENKTNGMFMQTPDASSLDNLPSR